jgi:hypothetical protein
MVMSPVWIRIKNHCACKGQQQLAVSQAISQQSVGSWTWWLAAFSCIVSSCYLAATTGNLIQREDFMSAVVIAINRACKSVRLLQLFVYKHSINPLIITNPWLVTNTWQNVSYEFIAVTNRNKNWQQWMHWKIGLSCYCNITVCIINCVCFVLKSITNIFVSWCSSVCVVIRLQPGKLEKWDSFHSWAMWDSPASYPIGTGSKAAGASGRPFTSSSVKVTNVWNCTSTPSHIFILWWLITN